MDAKNSQDQQPEVTKQQWQYQSGQLEQRGGFGESPITIPQAQSTGPTVSWTASEFISHEKSGNWYVFLIVVAIVIAGALFFVTREWFSVVVVVVLAIALGVFGALKPRTLDYAIYPDGIQVGEKHFGFETFRSFAIIEDAPVPSLQLLPQKRLMVPITVYFAPPDADMIINTLGDFLPIEQKKRDFVDKISARIRF